MQAKEMLFCGISWGNKIAILEMSKVKKPIPSICQLEGGKKCFF